VEANGVAIPVKIPSESKENFVWSFVDRHLGNQSKVVGIRPEESADFATKHKWKFVEEHGSLESWQLYRNECVSFPITVEAGPPNEYAYDFHENTTNNVARPESSRDDGTQHEDLFMLLNVLKINKCPFREGIHSVMIL